MKKILVTILSMVMILFITSINTQAQYSYEPPTVTPIDFSLWAGYSWTSTGILGAEAQFGLIGLQAGWTPTSYPGSGESTSSFSAAISVQGKNNHYLNHHNGAAGACFYGSLGVASKGYRRQIDYGSGWGDNYSSAMMIAMGGVKSYAGGWMFKLGCGYGWCDEANSFAWEIGLGYSLFKNHN